MATPFDQTSLESLEVGAAPVVRHFLEPPRSSSHSSHATYRPTTGAPKTSPPPSPSVSSSPTSCSHAGPSTASPSGLPAASPSTSASSLGRSPSSATTASDAPSTASTAPTAPRCSPPWSCAPCASSTSTAADAQRHHHRHLRGGLPQPGAGRAARPPAPHHLRLQQGSPARPEATAVQHHGQRRRGRAGPLQDLRRQRHRRPGPHRDLGLPVPIVGHADFLYVADSKLCTRDNMSHIAGRHGRFLTVCPGRAPRTVGSATTCRSTRRPGVRSAASRTRAGRTGRTSSTTGWRAPQRTAEGYRVLWYRSSQKREEDCAQRQARLERARAAAGGAAGAGPAADPRSYGRGPAGGPARCCSEERAERWLRVRVETEVEEELSSGRPGPAGAGHGVPAGRDADVIGCNSTRTGRRWRRTPCATDCSRW